LRSISSTYGFGFNRSWISKAIKSLPKYPNLFIKGNRASRDIRNILGIGPTKVESLKAWLEFMEITDKSGGKLSDIGNIIFEFDQTIEEKGTWFYIHYKLTQNFQIWNQYISNFQLKKFRKNEFREHLKKIYKEFSERTINNALLSLFSAMRDTPLGNELGFMVEEEGYYYKKEPPEKKLSPLIFAYILADWMKTEVRTSVHSSELFERGGPARILNLSTNRVEKYLSTIRDNYGKELVWISTTAGLNSIRRNEDIDPLVILIAYYQQQVEGVEPPRNLQEAIDYYNKNLKDSTPEQQELPFHT